MPCRPCFPESNVTPHGHSMLKLGSVVRTLLRCFIPCTPCLDHSTAANAIEPASKINCGSLASKQTFKKMWLDAVLLVADSRKDCCIERHGSDVQHHTRKHMTSIAEDILHCGALSRCKGVFSVPRECLIYHIGTAFGRSDLCLSTMMISSAWAWPAARARHRQRHGSHAALRSLLRSI